MVAGSLRALAALLLSSGVLHLLCPRPYVAIVPRLLPHKRELVLASGVAEIACAALLARPATRPVGGLASAALLALVFPANVQMAVSAVRDRDARRAYQTATLLRLPLQWPMIRTALRAAAGR